MIRLSETECVTKLFHLNQSKRLDINYYCCFVSSIFGHLSRSELFLNLVLNFTAFDYWANGNNQLLFSVFHLNQYLHLPHQLWAKSALNDSLNHHFPWQQENR
mmetsp:Transcript_4943/g.6431  ORF Transcript_4943/g.6431 Transcript_4943/m.6431 type:complete len:103 (+) Transcript_4943:586-894(+)